METASPPHPTHRHRALSLLHDLRHQIVDGELLMTASSLAYTTILSIIPLLAVSFSIFHAFGGMEKLYASLEPIVIQNLAQGQGEDVLAKIHGFIGNINAGAVGISGFAGLVLTCTSMLSSVEKAINRVWGVAVSRRLLARIATYWLLIALGPLAFAFALGFASSSYLPITRFFPSGTGAFLISIAFFSAIYKLVPEPRVHWRPMAGGAVFAAAAWHLARILYGVYTSHVFTYSKIYGSLGAVPILVLWIYIAWVIVLTGAALSAILQKRIENLTPHP